MAHPFLQPTDPTDCAAGLGTDGVCGQVRRIKSEDLFLQNREIEIDDQGRIYRLRLTQLNKLILTA